MLTLSACTQVPRSPAPPITLRECQAVTRCTLPAMTPGTNGDLDAALHVAKAAWATCAAKVDMIFDCQKNGPHPHPHPHPRPAPAATHD
ncbi:Rz1-like lysis system protein LysC [Paraburkholderia phenazinium]|uniref:Rz1-like lysis system protein LysC n=1 Tax=Paraburkholderia phenazinium TaxID=60549 RepID=UPI001FC80595|nr:Rz1-like lysis system protein LysC [Paraburkholderia phenazinium]